MPTGARSSEMRSGLTLSGRMPYGTAQSVSLSPSNCSHPWRSNNAGGKVAGQEGTVIAQDPMLECGRPELQWRAILAGVAGNVMEWYDFSVYGYFAAVIGRRFFPAEDPIASLLAAF